MHGSTTGGDEKPPHPLRQLQLWLRDLGKKRKRKKASLCNCRWKQHVGAAGVHQWSGKEEKEKWKCGLAKRLDSLLEAHHRSRDFCSSSSGINSGMCKMKAWDTYEHVQKDQRIYIELLLTGCLLNFISSLIWNLSNYFSLIVCACEFLP